MAVFDSWQLSSRGWVAEKVEVGPGGRGHLAMSVGFGFSSSRQRGMLLPVVSRPIKFGCHQPSRSLAKVEECLDATLRLPELAFSMG